MIPTTELKVGYVLKRFPRFSETFVLNEVLELERRGVDVRIFSLLQPPTEPRHELVASLVSPVTYLPRRDSQKTLKIASGSCAANRCDTDLSTVFGKGFTPFAGLFPGKKPEEIVHLCVQATTVAMLASAHGIKHLHAHFASNATVVALLASRLANIPFSFTAHARDIYHTYIDPETDDLLRQRKINEAAIVVTVSDYNQRHLQGLVDASVKPRIRRLYNGVDLERFHPQPKSNAAEAFVGVGRLVKKKGFTDLIEACRILQRRGRRFHCWIIGDGPERQSLQNQIDAAGLNPIVKLVGPQPQERLVDTMRNALAVVLPCVVSDSGDRDGLPTVLLEAMAMGLPTVSTRVAGIPEIIDHERTGFLSPPNNPARLAEAMEHLLNDPSLRRRFGDASRRKAEREFSLRSNVATLANYFVRSAAGKNFDTKEDGNAYCLRHRG